MSEESTIGSNEVFLPDKFAHTDRDYNTRRSIGVVSPFLMATESVNKLVAYEVAIGERSVSKIDGEQDFVDNLHEVLNITLHSGIERQFYASRADSEFLKDRIERYKEDHETDADTISALQAVYEEINTKLNPEIKHMIRDDSESEAERMVTIEQAIEEANEEMRRTPHGFIRPDEMMSSANLLMEGIDLEAMREDGSKRAFFIKDYEKKSFLDLLNKRKFEEPPLLGATYNFESIKKLELIDSFADSLCKGKQVKSKNSKVEKYRVDLSGAQIASFFDFMKDCEIMPSDKRNLLKKMWANNMLSRILKEYQDLQKTANMTERIKRKFPFFK